jgi:hypothetical protein
MPENGLAKALADFQGRIGAIPRSKTVRVTSKKTGQSYTFDYAPHEAIIAAIQKPLAECGLAVSQQLACLPDGLPALRTILLHSSGERLDDVFPLPTAEGMTSQELGSTITYMRRYALSAILGLATEDDDDANRAAGNEARFAPPRQGPEKRAAEARREVIGAYMTSDLTGDQVKPVLDALAEVAGDSRREGDLIGVAEVAKPPHDFELRQTPDGAVIGFALKEGREIVRVVAYGQLASEIAAFREAVEGKRVQCFGRMTQESWTVKKGTKDERQIAYTRLLCSHLTGPDGLALPMPDTAAPTEPLFSPEEDAAIEAALP